MSEELSPEQFGPDVSKQYPLGWYVEDFDFQPGLGDLDISNGRFAVTPEYPLGTYAYYVTIDAAGKPAFPYVIGRYYNGVPQRARGHVDGLKDATKGDARITSWMTRDRDEYAHVVPGYSFRNDPKTTWPGQDKPVKAGIQQVKSNNDWVVVEANGVASHTMGPWYDPDSPTGVFPNWPQGRRFEERFTRHPQTEEKKTLNQLGPLGRWVNGVAVFNMLDGASYSHQAQADRHSAPRRPL